jgi:hypothetical protein
MAASIIKGRTLGFSATPHAGTFPGALTYTNACVETFPDLGDDLALVETTDSCTTGTNRKEFISGLGEGKEVEYIGIYKGSDAGDWGIASGTLFKLCNDGSTVGLKDTSAQSPFSADLVARFDAVGLGATLMGGGPGDVQKVKARFKISSGINWAAS